MLRTSARRGFALPMAILVVAILSLSLAAAYAVLGSERRVADNQQGQADAFSLAQSGLEQFIAQRTQMGFTATPPDTLESTRVYQSDGYADVVLQRIRPAVTTDPTGPSNPLYVIRSTGVPTVPSLAGTPAAERTVALYAEWLQFPMRVPAGWTSLTGLRKNGGSGTLSGGDGCGMMPDVAGVAVPAAPGYQQTGGSSVPTGSPPILYLGPDPVSSEPAVEIDWAEIVNDNVLQPEIVIPPQSWPSFADPTYWPVIRVNGDLEIPGGTVGRGTLIVTGSLTMSGDARWDGVVLVGGAMTSNGNNTVEGALVSGLNVKLGQNPGESDVGNGTKTFRYNSCNVASALARFATLYAYPNAWMDSWATY